MFKISPIFIGRCDFCQRITDWHSDPICYILEMNIERDGLLDEYAFNICDPCANKLKNKLEDRGQPIDPL